MSWLEHLMQQSYSLLDSQEAKRKRKEGAGDKIYSSRAHPPVNYLLHIYPTS
jgi:hypothetical protein